VNHASVPEARIFILLLLGHALISGHWSFSYERWLGSAYVGVPTARLQAVAYKYRLFLLPVGVVCYALWEVPTIHMNKSVIPT
jgi:hypothetical protein